MNQIMVVEDEEDIRELMVMHLQKEGYEVLQYAQGDQAIDSLRKGITPHLMLLDLMLPGMNGLEICRKVKGEMGKDFPILMVTARGSEQDIVQGLEAGADDYIVKPFSMPILLARVRSAIRRLGRGISLPAEKNALNTHGIQMDEKRHVVLVDQVDAELTSSEFSLLKFLSEHPGWVYTRSQIVKAVHGDNYPVTDRSVDVMVLSLRRKLGERGKAIETVRGVGYRFAELT